MEEGQVVAAQPRRRRIAVRRRRAVDPQELVVETVTRHADALLRVARRYAGNQADAEDAYQRALEILVRNAHRLDPSSVHRWLFTVTKHEALAVRGQGARYVGVGDEQTLEALDDGRHVPSVEERSERFEELTRAAEALSRLKPQEVTALWLKAQGLSYQEIAERQGWTYTKVNRCITEGRRAFLKRFEGIQSGAECERWAPVLAALADGEATAEQLVEVRPHLRNCAGCRSMLGGMRRSGAQVAALLPPALLAADRPSVSGGGVVERFGDVLLGLQERMAAPIVKAQAALDAMSATKVAAVAASAAAIAGGGVAIERSAGGDAPGTVGAAVAPRAAGGASDAAAPTGEAAPAGGAGAASADGPGTGQRDESGAAASVARRADGPRRGGEHSPEAEFAPEASPPRQRGSRSNAGAAAAPAGDGNVTSGQGASSRREPSSGGTGGVSSAAGDGATPAGARDASAAEAPTAASLGSRDGGAGTDEFGRPRRSGGAAEFDLAGR